MLFQDFIRNLILICWVELHFISVMEKQKHKNVFAISQLHDKFLDGKMYFTEHHFIHTLLLIFVSIPPSDPLAEITFSKFSILYYAIFDGYW